MIGITQDNLSTNCSNLFRGQAFDSRLSGDRHKERRERLTVGRLKFPCSRDAVGVLQLKIESEFCHIQVGVIACNKLNEIRSW